MARPIDPAPVDPNDPSDPGDPGYVPPTQPGTKLAFIVVGSSVTITEDQIGNAGGPWPAFTLRVTPINDTGSGPAASVDYPPAPPPTP